MTITPSATLFHTSPTAAKPWVRSTILRSGLLGEYASLLILVHSLFGAVCWAFQLHQNPLMATVMVLSGIWMAFRSIGGGAGEWWAAMMTGTVVVAAIVLAIIGVRYVPGWLSGSIVSPSVWMIMAVVLLITDLLDLRDRARVNLDDVGRRKLDGRLLKLTFAGLFLLWGVGVPVGTLIGQLSRPDDGKPRLEEMSFIEHVGFRCGEAMVTACFFALGANVGSFLNVVVWRMPIGRSIVHGDSCCPVCNTKIAGRDNIPIFGWLGLGGRCRQCQTEISSRYPKVEALVACIFLLFYFVELISGGANLPLRPINTYRGVLWVIMYAKWDLIGLYLFHCFLFATVVVWMQMLKNGNPVPRRMMLITLAIGLICPIAFPQLVLVPALPPFTASTGTVSVATRAAAINVLVGAVLGGLIGLLATWLLINRPYAQQSHKVTPFSSNLVWLFALAGSVLGWQAALTPLLISVGIQQLTKRLADKPVSLASTILIALVFQHLTWRLQWLSLG